MKMPMNWAKEFAEFECTPQEFADRMTMSGSKVETYECEADGIKNVVVGKILEIVPHPDSDHMVVCQVDVGRDAPVQIVTGANNLKVGDLVPAALHVAKLPGGKEIRRGKLRGVESGGMLCSLSELGLTTHDFPNAVEDGILVLDEEWPRTVLPLCGRSGGKRAREAQPPLDARAPAPVRRAPHQQPCGYYKLCDAGIWPAHALLRFEICERRAHHRAQRQGGRRN